MASSTTWKAITAIRQCPRDRIAGCPCWPILHLQPAICTWKEEEEEDERKARRLSTSESLGQLQQLRHSQGWVGSTFAEGEPLIWQGVARKPHIGAASLAWLELVGRVANLCTYTIHKARRGLGLSD